MATGRRYKPINLPPGTTAFEAMMLYPPGTRCRAKTRTGVIMSWQSFKLDAPLDYLWSLQVTVRLHVLGTRTLSPYMVTVCQKPE